MEIHLGRALGAPKLRRTLPRGSWRAIFLPLKILSNFDSSWVAFWVDFGSQMGGQKLGGSPHFSLLKSVCIWKVVFVAARRPKRCPRAPRDLPKMPSGGHFWHFWLPSWVKFAPKSQRRLCISMLQISQRSTKTKHFNPQGQ